MDRSVWGPDRLCRGLGFRPAFWNAWGERTVSENVVGALVCVNGAVALIDPEDQARLHGYTWYASSIGVSRKEGKRTIYLHREVMGEPAGLYVGFKNENKLDCRRENLFVFEPGKRKEALARLLEVTASPLP